MAAQVAAGDVDEQYDLKGSTVNRSVGAHRYGEAGLTYKDLDWLEFGHRVHVTSRQRVAIMDQLSKDAAFLEKTGVMDYSMLLGVRRQLSLPVPIKVAATAAACGGNILDWLKHCWRSGGPSDEMLAGEKRQPPFPAPPLHRSDAATGGLRSAAEPVTTCYYLGIIDVLQKWNARKKAETTLKRVRHLSVSATPAFSCVDPKTYRARFLSFAKDKVFAS